MEVSSFKSWNLIINEQSLLDPAETLFYAVSSTSGRVVQYQVKYEIMFIIPKIFNIWC